MILLLLSACAPTEAPCTPASVASFAPEDGAALVSPDQAITFTLDAPSEQVSVWVDGGVTDGWVDLEGGELAYTIEPSAALDADRVYTVSVETCGEDAGEASFTTLPPPVGDAVVGQTYVLDLLDEELQWVEPPVAPPSTLLSYALAATTSLLLMPTAAGDGSLDLIAALGEDDGGPRQHDCVSPATVTGADFSADPAFALEPIDITVIDRGAPFVLSGVSVSGVFDEDGAGVTGLRLAGAVDVRQIDSNEDYDFCGLLAETYEATCIPCADQQEGGETSCLLIDAIDPWAPAAEGLVLDPDLEPEEGC